MKVLNIYFDSVKLLKPNIISDSRGFFQESYNLKKFQAIGINENFIQDNHSFSKDKHTLRGIHFQSPPMAQAKIVRVLRGSVLDVVVDLRSKSKSFGEWATVELSEDNQHQLYIPEGFGHAFITLSENCHFVYKVSNYYSHEHNCGIKWDDPQINIKWPTTNPILSVQDEKWSSLNDLPEYF